MDPNHYMNSNVSPDRYLWDMWIKPVLHEEKGISIGPDAIKSTKYQTGRLFFATGHSNDEVCFVFNSVFWNKNQFDPLGQGDTNVRGGVCLPPTHPQGENLEHQMLDLLTRMRFS